MKTGLTFRPKACLRCGGDAYLSRGDDLEWRCLQCGRAVESGPSLLRIETAPDERVGALSGGRRKAA